MSAVCLLQPPNLPGVPMRYAHLLLFRCHALIALAKGSNISAVVNLSSTQLEPTLRSDPKPVSEMPGPGDATSTVASDNGATTMPPGKTKRTRSSRPAKPGLASSAALDRLGFEPAAPSQASYPTR